LDSVIVGPNGASVGVGILSTPDSVNCLGVYRCGDRAGSPVTTEIFPAPVTHRASLYWGIAEWGDVSASLSFQYTELPGISNAAELRLLKRNSATGVWFLAADSVVVSNDLEAGRFYIPSTGSFGEYAIGGTSANPLPVQMTGLNARHAGRVVELSWSTCSESDNAGWEVERRAVIGRPSTVDGPWTRIGWVEGAGTSTSPLGYTFTDPGPNPESPITRLAYRLKQIDRSGSFTYSPEAEIEIALATGGFGLSDAFPNPCNPTTTLTYQLPEPGTCRISVCDLLGREVAIVVDGAQAAGEHRATWNAAGLTSGVYVIRLTANGTSVSRRVMLLR
jgi:hypothetical protein